MMDFVAIDVETANADFASVCQIGMARFSAGNLVDEWSSLVDPEDEFDDINSQIHGIRASDVADAPTYPDLHDIVGAWSEQNLMVSHTSFDQTSMFRVTSRYGLVAPPIRWLDSAGVARRTWKQVAYKGYGLANLCVMLGYEYQAHDALEEFAKIG